MKYHLYYKTCDGKKRYLSSFSANTETNASVFSDNIEDAAQMEYNNAWRIGRFLDSFSDFVHHISHA